MGQSVVLGKVFVSLSYILFLTHELCISLIGENNNQNDLNLHFKSICYSLTVFIFEIGHNFAKIWVHACKNIVCMHTSLCAWVLLCAQISLECFPDFIDTSISQI